MQKKVVGHGIQAESARGIHGMVQVARYLPGVAVEAKTLDNHRHLLNVRNGDAGSDDLPAPRPRSEGHADATDRGAVRADGTTVRVGPSTSVQVRGQRLTLAQLEPGSEIVIRAPATPARSPADARGAAQIGGAAPREDLPSPTVDASEVQMVWAPSMR